MPALDCRSRRLRRGVRVLVALAASLPLLVGPAFAGSRMLWHDHGEQGVHGHLLMGLASSDHHAAHHGQDDDPHDGHHDRRHDRHHDQHQHAHAPHGVVVELPSLPLRSPGAARAAQAIAQMLAWDAWPLGFQGVMPRAHAPQDRRGRGSVPISLETGAERVLRSSHAMLI